MPILESLRSLSPLPLALVMAALLLVVIASAGAGRTAGSVGSARFWSEIAVIVPTYAASVAFLGKVPSNDPGLLQLIAGLGGGASAVLWSAAAVAVGVSVIPIFRRQVHRARLTGMLLLGSGLCFAVSLATAAWRSRLWLESVSFAGWFLLLVVIGLYLLAFRENPVTDGDVRGGSSHKAVDRCLVAVSVGFAATAMEFLATGSRHDVLGEREIVVAVASAVTVSFLWSGIGLLVATALWNRSLRR